ncbi:MAG: MmcQ/YjbR family DNA-binding protein [Bacilli bacterium]|nr:MmcQ/YjbR family DNA-binding protein [Bacilli bacterium]
MNIENDIFKRSIVNTNKLTDYGFIKDNNKYTYEKEFFNNFKAIITIENNTVIGKVIDLEVNEEYISLRTNTTGEFVNTIREEYKKILEDIKKNCFETRYFIFDQSNRLTEYIKNKYNNTPEFLWEKFKGFGVFRNTNSEKWYALIANVDYSKLDNKTGEVEIINLKLDENKIIELLKKKGFYKAYHMSKKDWISIILNDTIKDEEIEKLIDESYNLVK